MAMAMDRSKYRNPDMPIGYVKKEPSIEYKYGEVLDGVHYVYAPYLHEAYMENYDDYHNLSELILSDDEVIIDCVKDASENPRPSSSSISPSNNETNDVTEVNKEDFQVFGGTRKKVHAFKKHSVKGQGSSDTSTLNLYPCMDIDSEKHRRRETQKSLNYTKSGYRSSSSDRSSRSPPNYKRRDIKIIQEPREQNHLFGSYLCEVCNLTVTSKFSYEVHLNGKRHRKNLKMKKLEQVVSQNIPATVLSKDQSHYPSPARGIIRKQTDKTAKIQPLIESTIKRACPGLHHITEILGIGGTQYFCSICNVVCSSSSIISHLLGFKHKLNSLRIYKPGMYERIQFEPKFRIENDVLEMLDNIQKKEGMGRLAVEVEEFDSDYEDEKYNHPRQHITNRYYTSKHRRQPSTSTDYTNQPSTSRGTSNKQSGKSFFQIYNEATIPKVSASDYFCKVCQSHMNSLDVWDSHIRGKRHLTNLKKMSGGSLWDR